MPDNDNVSEAALKTLDTMREAFSACDIWRIVEGCPEIVSSWEGHEETETFVARFDKSDAGLRRRDFVVALVNAYPRLAATIRELRKLLDESAIEYEGACQTLDHVRAANAALVRERDGLREAMEAARSALATVHWMYPYDADVKAAVLPAIEKIDAAAIAVPADHLPDAGQMVPRSVQKRHNVLAGRPMSEGVYPTPAGEGSVLADIRAEQSAGRQKYGRGPDDTEHDDSHTIEEWAAFITDHAKRASVATPIEARQELVKVAGLALSAIESFDRKSADEGSGTNGSVEIVAENAGTFFTTREGMFHHLVSAHGHESWLISGRTQDELQGMHDRDHHAWPMVSEVSGMRPKGKPHTHPKVVKIMAFATTSNVTTVFSPPSTPGAAAADA